MKHLEDKRLCPHCGAQLHRQPYLMSRRSEELVLSPRTIGLFVVFITALVLFSLHS